MIPNHLRELTTPFLPAGAAAAPIICLNLLVCCPQQVALPVCRCHASVCPHEPSCCPPRLAAYGALPLQQQQQPSHRRRKGQRDAQQAHPETPEAQLQRHQQQQLAAGKKGKTQEGIAPPPPPTLFNYLDGKLSSSAGAGSNQLPRTHFGGDAAGGCCKSSWPLRVACCVDDRHPKQEPPYFGFSSLWIGRCRWALQLLGVAC